MACGRPGAHAADGAGLSGPSGLPDPAACEQAAAVLNDGSRVAMLVGAGALGARQQVLETAELLASPIVKTLPGKAAVPDNHPYTTGGLGLLGTRPSEQVMEEADTLLMVGTNFPYTRHLPEPGQVRTVQIDADPVLAGNRMPTDVPIVGDAAKTLRALLPLLKRHDDRGFLERAQQAMAKWRHDMTALEDPGRDPIQPQYLARVVDRLASDDAILTADSGTIATWAARHFDIRGQRELYLSGNLATMAPALPYAIAA
jgi:pyruvate dehydrogenase (quinone)